MKPTTKGGFALLALLAAVPCRAQVGTPVTPPAESAPTAATASPTGAVDPNQIVELDLGSGQFLAPLPFDVPFVVRGTVTPDVRLVTARMLRFADFVNCAQHQLELRQAPSLGPASLVTDGGQPKFLLPMPPLQVNRYYCFQFEQRKAMPAADRQKLRDAAFQAIDQALQAPLPPAQQTAVYEQLRADLRATVQRLLPDGTVLEAPPGSFLSGDSLAAAKGKNLPEFVAFDQILAQQANRQIVVNEFRDRATTLADALARLAGSDSYARLAAALQHGRASSVSLDEELKAKARALDLVGKSRPDLEALSFGLDPGTAIPNLDQLFSPAAAQAVVVHLEGTKAGIDDLIAVVDALNQNQVLRSAAGLDDASGHAALTALPDLAVAARRAAGNVVFTARGLADLLTGRAALILDLVKRIDGQVQETFPIQGTTLGGFELRASWYISADVGIAVASRIDEVFAYVGANVYLRPVNKRAHLRWSSFRHGFWNEFGKRFAFVVGLPYETLDKPGQRSGLISNRPLLVGAGFRINDLIRLSAGALIFKKDDPDPLVDHQSIGSTPFVSVSVDWDVKSLFVNIFKGATGGVATP